MTQPGEALWLAQAVRAREIGAPQFEKANARLLAVEVVGQGSEQAAPQRGAHHRHLAGDGILQREGVSPPESASSHAGSTKL